MGTFCLLTHRGGVRGEELILGGAVLPPVPGAHERREAVVVRTVVGQKRPSLRRSNRARPGEGIIIPPPSLSARKLFARQVRVVMIKRKADIKTHGYISTARTCNSFSAMRELCSDDDAGMVARAFWWAPVARPWRFGVWGSTPVRARRKLIYFCAKLDTAPHRSSG